MARAAESIIQENQLSSSHGGPITVLSGRIEDLQALPMQEVSPDIQLLVSWCCSASWPWSPNQLGSRLFLIFI